MSTSALPPLPPTAASSSSSHVIQRPLLGAFPSSQSDAFLSSRLSNTKRNDKGRRPTHVSAKSMTLEIVPEDGAIKRSSGPPSSFRFSGGVKGKEREEIKRAPSQDSIKRKRTEWVLDLVETGKGADRWGERERVILVTGSPSVDALAPILYNPTFSNTLLLVGTIDPLPSIEALTSPSYLMQTSHDRTIFPTLQPFSLSSSKSSSAADHPLPAIIEEAAELALTYRKTALAQPQPRLPSRRDSDDSVMSISPPKTPDSLHLPVAAFGEVQIRRSSDSGSSDSHRPAILSDTSRNDMNKSGMESPIQRPTSRSRLSTLSMNRKSTFGSLSKTKSGKAWNGGSAIDAVINFIPPASDFEAQRTMQEMLHQAVVLTTGIVPSLARRQAKSPNGDLCPISIIHILPSQVPGPLPGVLENFLLGLLPKFAVQSDRELWSSVITTPAWLAPPRQVNNESFSGSEVLLFGGVRCPLSTDSETKSRAFLPNWGVCENKPGAISRAQPRRPAPISLKSEPPSIGYAGTVARTPPIPYEESLSRGNMPANPKVIYKGSYPGQSIPARIPSTPELDSSYSSASSVSCVGEVRSNKGSEERDGLASLSGKTKKKGLGGWFKSIGKN